MLLTRRKDVLFHQDTPYIAMAAMHQAGFDLVDSPQCSPNLTPGDNRLLPKLKRKCTWEKNSGNVELMQPACKEVVFRVRTKIFPEGC